MLVARRTLVMLAACAALLPNAARAGEVVYQHDTMVPSLPVVSPGVLTYPPPEAGPVCLPDDTQVVFWVTAVLVEGHMLYTAWLQTTASVPETGCAGGVRACASLFLTSPLDSWQHSSRECATSPGRAASAVTSMPVPVYGDERARAYSDVVAGAEAYQTNSWGDYRYGCRDVGFALVTLEPTRPQWQPTGERPC